MDPEYAAWFASALPSEAAAPPVSATTDIKNIRPTQELFIAALFAKLPPADPSIKQTSYTVTSEDGTAIEILRFSPSKPATATTPTPAILHLHGGGHVSNAASTFAPALSALASATSIPVFTVSFRLAPEHPFPAALHDAYAALSWLSASHAALDIDPGRIALLGESSGGGLAAGLALLARDRGLAPALARVVLTAPMLDDRAPATWGAASPFGKVLELCWAAYLRGVSSLSSSGSGEGDAAAAAAVAAGDAEASVYAAPGRADVSALKGFPACWVEVGSLDDFLPECEAFVSRLVDAGVKAELKIRKGVGHGFEVARGVGVSDRAWEERVEVFRELLRVD